MEGLVSLSVVEGFVVGSIMMAYGIFGMIVLTRELEHGVIAVLGFLLTFVPPLVAQRSLGP